MAIKNPFLIIGVLITIAVISIFVIPSETSISENQHSTITTKAENEATAFADSTRSEFIEELGYSSAFGSLSLPLEGTPLAASLAIDEDGNLRISSDIRQVFDYFLSAITEEPLETVLGRINEYLAHHLNEPALSQAKTILTQYVDLKTALYDLEQELSEQIKSGNLSKQNYLELLKYQLDQRNSLRAQILSTETHEAFYQEEEQYDHFTYERMVIQQASDLSDAEKAEQIALLEQQLPEDVQQARKETQITDILKARTAELKEQGASQEEIRALRQDMFGSEAVARFDQLDQERADWQARIDTYFAERTQLLENDGLSEEDKRTQIQALKDSMFDEREQIRVSYFERKAVKG